MRKSQLKRLIIATLIVAIFCTSIIAILIATKKTYSAFSNVYVPGGNNVAVYVSGNDVIKASDGNYTAPPGKTITVTVVNEKKLFKSMTINGTPFNTPVQTITVPDDGDLVITVDTIEPYAEDKGKYFGNPYILNKEADVLAVARILAGTATISDYKQIGAPDWDADAIRYGYFRLGTNLFINSSEFFGLGFRGESGRPFGGCFDFDDYTVTINIVRTSYVSSEFVNDGSINIADYGFFSYIYGDGTNPCFIKNAKMQGFIGINMTNSVSEPGHKERICIGGLAATLGKNVILDGIESSVSVGAQTRMAELYLGGIFGICSSSVDSWCDVRYDGSFNDISGVTYGEKANVIAGTFAGAIHNASIDGVTIDAERSMVLANSLGEISGSAIAGGFVGVIELGSSVTHNLSSPRPIVIKNIEIFAERDFSVSSVINNSGSTKKDSIDPDKLDTDSAGAVAGGVVGTVNRRSDGTTVLGDDMTISFSAINFKRTSSEGSGSGGTADGGTQGRLLIHASTQDGNSSGSVYAGGAVGYVYDYGGNHVKIVIPDDAAVNYYFNCPVDITAVQNGVGPAYAGGVFGYNALRSDYGNGKTLRFGIVAPQYDFTVTACQSATSKRADNVYYNVCAGGYTSRFNVGYNLSDVVFHLGNGRITAYREVGSTAIGNIDAGGLAGRLIGYGDEKITINGYDRAGSQSGSVNNLTIYYSDNARIEASCYSYDSLNSNRNSSQNPLGNNVCSGGAFGYILGYSSISNVSVEYVENTYNSGKPTELFICGTQNGANLFREDADLKTEGCIGGMFGLVIDTKITNISLSCNPTENSVVYFSSSNSPNTASVGGLIGMFNRRKRSFNQTTGIYMLDGASVKNVHVAGKAYCDKNNSQDTYDLYVGGAIGVMGNPNGGSFSVNNIRVSDCVIDAIGEKTMLPYAGGVVAGMWWSSSTNLSNAIVTRSSITASSIAPFAYAGGIAGLLQRSSLSYCLTQDTEVKAVSEQASAYAGGIAARTKIGGDGIRYSYSNASLKAQGKDANSSHKYGIIALIINSNNIASSAQSEEKNFFVYETAGTTAGYPGDNGSGALYLASGYENKLSVASGGYATVFPVITSGQNGKTMSVVSYDETIARMNGLSVNGVSRGITYVGAYCKIAGEDYFLCSYPVTVDGATENSSGLNLVTDDGENVAGMATDAYVEYTSGSGTSSINYIYFRRNIGNPDTVKKVNVVPVNAEYLPSTIRFYDISLDNHEYFTESTTDAEKRARIASIIAAKGATCDISAFNGRANIGFNYADGVTAGGAKKSLYLYCNDNVREPTVVLMECVYGYYTYGVIVEFIPNKLVGIEIAPESGTSPLGSYVVSEQNPNTGVVSDVTHYIYNVGETIRFGATLTYKYPAPRSYVVETIYSGSGITENGVLVVNNKGSYNVFCRDLKNNVNTFVVIEAKEEISVSFSFLGAEISFERKMVEDCRYVFTVSPQPGYGLNPVISVTVNGVTAEAEFAENSISVRFGSQTFVFALAKSEAEYSYAVTVGEDFVNYAHANGNSVGFDVKYNKTYSLVFISNFNGNEFLSTTVAAGEKFLTVSPDGFEDWVNTIINSRYGYDFRGFYTLSGAGDVTAYGKSFEDMQKDGVSIVSGTMRFYARWTYNITVEAPAGINVSSTMPVSMLHDGVIIPLDANNGFGFVIQKGDDWIGKPAYKAFIRTKAGAFTEITPLFTAANEQNGYYIPSEHLENLGSGYIYVKVFSDSLELAVGDDPRYDGNALYTDGIFTVTYNANYGEYDTPGNFSFDFASSGLPEGASVRLFYQRNGVAVWSGMYKVESNVTLISLSDFVSLKNGSALTADVRQGAKSEKFILVVTLPNNTNKFGITAATNTSVGTERFDYKKNLFDFGEYSATVSDSPDTSGSIAKQQFVLYPAVVRSLVVTGNTVEFIEEGALNDEVADQRHNGIRYMWKMEKTGGGYIGKDTFEGLGNEVVRTTDAIYYTANVGKITIVGNLQGYSISLIEARNIRQPSASAVLYTHDFG